MKPNKKIWLTEHDIVQNGEGWVEKIAFEDAWIAERYFLITANHNKCKDGETWVEEKEDSEKRKRYFAYKEGDYENNHIEITMTEIELVPFAVD